MLPCHTLCFWIYFIYSVVGNLMSHYDAKCVMTECLVIKLITHTMRNGYFLFVEWQGK